MCLQNCFGPPQYVYYVSLVPVLLPHLSCHCYDRVRFSWLSFPSFYIGRIYLLWIFSLWAIQFTLGEARGCYRAQHRRVGSMCNSPKVFGGRTTSWTLWAGKKGKQPHALKWGLSVRRSSHCLKMTAIDCTQAVKIKGYFSWSLERKAGARGTDLGWSPKHFLMILVASHTLKT